MLAYLEESDLLEENELYAAVGEEGFRRLVAGFYRRVPADEILGPMYPAHDLAGAEKRLADFLIYRFGGPETYIVQRGHPRLRMRHNPFTIDAAARDRWLQLMVEAAEESGFPPEALDTLFFFFAQMATFLINKGDQLPVAH
jgi:hemoglobin